ncbi:MAG: NAD(P)/FAD-dependent oxidoreductase [Terriglobales bacterium]
MRTPQTAVIIGAGPAGLTVAYELLTRAGIRPIVLERSTYMGGISRTINYKGNRMDIGGHRFFSKSERVMNWWLRHMPLAEADAAGTTIAYRQSQTAIPSDARAAAGDTVMLVRQRKSRIYFLRKFFDYPIQLTKDTLLKLGLRRTMRIGFSYLRSALFPIKDPRNLEQFFINRFGRELYLTFFKSYTEKVWGVPCDHISAEWGAQRIKGLSIRKAIAHFVRQSFGDRNGGIAQKGTETSLIEQFLYPKLGPGQMWEEVARKVVALGGEIITETDVSGVEVEGNRIIAVTARGRDGQERRFAGDVFFSTTSVQELVRALRTEVPANVREVAEGLQYRDFVTVGLLLNKLKIQDPADKFGKLISDNWIYVQEPDVLVGRLQIFNNWSPFLVADQSKVWLGAEYFCYESDELWRMTDEQLGRLAADELAKIDIIDRAHVLDWTVARMPKTYPAYFGAYERFNEVREYLDSLENLYLIGRNGMHKYNNQDHSMLTAMVAVDNIIAGVCDKSNIWAVNTEAEYHEEKQEQASGQAAR